MSPRLPALEKLALVAPKIGIIGAGVAGLRAAQILLEKGYNVQIFEARDRVGGRICSSSELGKPMDLGPNWIHGTKSNPIVPLAEVAGSTLHEFADQHTSTIFDPQGKMIEQKEADELQVLMWNIVDEAVEYSMMHCRDIDPDKSLLDFCEQRCEEMFKRKEGGVKWKGMDQRKELLLQMMQMWGTFVGTGVERQSLKFFYLEEAVEGPNLFVADTYTSMIASLAAPALEAGIVNLSTPITKITSVEGTAVELSTPTSHHIFDAVIVTAPLGCLKTDQLKFTPPLPPRITSAISALSYGQLEKVLITFPEAFWMSPHSPSASVYTFLTPEYSTTNTHMCAFSLAHLPLPHASPTLLFYLFAPLSQQLTAQHPRYDTPEGLAAYTEFFQPFFSKLPNYSQSDAACTPAKVLTTNWGSDKWAGYGSYSNFLTGLVDGEEDIEALREGWEEGRVWFAGEHTAPVLGLGSVSGAWWSGEQVVERVHKALKKPTAVVDPVATGVLRWMAGEA